MTAFAIEIRGINRVRNSLRKLVAMDKNILEPELRNWMQNLRKELKSTPYPPRRSNQRYKRTGRLGNSWAVDSAGTGKWKITNRVKYASWVVGDKQAWMHVGRWWQARPIIEKNIPKLTQSISKKVEDTWNRG